MPSSAQQVSPNRAEELRVEPTEFFDPPQFIIQWEGLAQAYVRRVQELFRPVPAPLKLTARPARFWNDVFVPERDGRAGFAISLMYHAALVAFLSLLPVLYLLAQRPQPHTWFQGTVTYYKVSPYLPEVHARSAPSRIARKAEPRLAPQRIVSVHEHADNFEQTILTAPRVKILPQHLALPNIVAETPLLGAPQAIPASKPKLIFPFAPPVVVPPAAKVNAEMLAKLKMPALPAPQVIQPPPDLQKMQTRLGALDLATPKVEAPAMPVATQHAPAATTNPQPKAQADKAPQAAPAPPPAVNAANLGTKAQGQLLALNLEPAVVRGSVEIPKGNRAGNFAVGPEGKANAPGTPGASAAETKSGGVGAKGASSGTGSPSGAKSQDPLNGISIDAPPANTAPVSAAEAVMQAPEAPQPHNRPSDSANDAQRLTARLQPSESIPAAHESEAVEGPESAVFGGKKYYSLTLNMPNLASAGGSWVIRFAQLGGMDAPGRLTAPEALEKVDPAYPPDLIADHVEGTVVLYAVIKRDGSVSGVRVLQSLESELDANACRALARWRFHPGTLNGVPVDLEAVVRIPFRAPRGESPF